MIRGAVFVEEPSAAEVVAAIAARLHLERHIQVIPHQGKNDLERSFRRKIGAWRHPADMRFIVARDNDGADCETLKERLRDLVLQDLRPRVKIRLVMQQLESWYLGDLRAVASAGLLSSAFAAANEGKGKYREPDRLTNASEIFATVCGGPGKIAAARSIGRHLDAEQSRSASFRHFVASLRWAAERDEEP